MRHYIVFVHGIGEQPRGSYSDFFLRLQTAYENAMKKAGKPKPPLDALVWREAYWADITQPDEQKMKARIGMGSKLRQFFIGSLGDAMAYSKLPYPPDKYTEIQKRFADSVLQAQNRAQQRSEQAVSVTVIAHSLGTVVASDGIYELVNKNKLPPGITIDRFFSMGSPIALFGLRYGLDNLTRPIRPGVWVNFFYPQDLIAYRLKTLNAAYDTAVSEDVSLSPGGSSNIMTNAMRGLAAALPVVGAASHSWYFTDKRVINKIAGILAQA